MEGKDHILESFIDGFFVTDQDWIITRWDEKAERILGKKKNEAPGSKLWQIYPGATESRFYKECTETMNDRRPRSFSEYFTHLNKWYEVIFIPSGKGIAVCFKDITEHSRLQEIHRRTEEISGVAGWELDVEAQSVYLTPKAYEIYGLNPDEPVSLEINRALYDDESLARIADAIDRAIARKEPYKLELPVTTEAGEQKEVLINGFPLVEDGEVRKIYGTLKDITRQKREEKKREEMIRKLKTAQEIAAIGYWTVNLADDTGEWSEKVIEIFEVEETFTPNLENWLETVHPDDREAVRLDFNTVFREGVGYHDFEHRIVTTDGRIKWILERVTLHRDEEGNPAILEGISQDITEKKEREDKILQSLKEKNVLLGEIHHRVKNNLAVISGIMQLQAFEEERDEVREKLMDCVTRVISMASIHEELYRAESFSDLDLSESLENLVRRIVDAMGGKTPIKLNFDLEDINLNVNQAIPFSLIVNEVITNIIKHAFPEQEKGQILLALRKNDNRVSLTIRDDGAGMPEAFEIDRDSSLGLRLVDLLAQQLNAGYRFDPAGNNGESGTEFSIEFDKTQVRGTGNANLMEEAE